jgi:DNA polymerase
VTPDERRAALDAIAAEVRECTRCPLHLTRTQAVPGEGHPDTEVLFVGEGPGANEDREGRPFVGRAGGLLERLLGHIGWMRDDVFITNVVKCRPPGNRDPEPDEIAACAPFLQRQAAVIDPAVVVTLGRFSMATFMPGVRITAAHGTTRLADPATGAADATVFAMFHPAYALRNPAVERESFEDMARVPGVLEASRARRQGRRAALRARMDERQAATDPDPRAARAPDARSAPAPEPMPAADAMATPEPPGLRPGEPVEIDQLSLF